MKNNLKELRQPITMENFLEKIRVNKTLMEQYKIAHKNPMLSNFTDTLDSALQELAVQLDGDLTVIRGVMTDMGRKEEFQFFRWYTACVNEDKKVTIVDKNRYASMWADIERHLQKEFEVFSEEFDEEVFKPMKELKRDLERADEMEIPELLETLGKALSIASKLK